MCRVRIKGGMYEEEDKKDNLKLCGGKNRVKKPMLMVLKERKYNFYFNSHKFIVVTDTYNKRQGNENNKQVL